MINMIKKFFDFCKEENKRKIAIKRYVINMQLINYYQDLQTSKGEYLEIPACTLAHQVMKENVKTDKDVNKFYKKLLKAGVV